MPGPAPPRFDGTAPLVQVTRAAFDAGGAPSVGLLLASSAAFVLLHKLSADFTLDGYEVIRTRDVTDLAHQFPRGDFYRRVLERKGLAARSPGAVDLGAPDRLLASAQALFPLLVVHEEGLRPDEVMVGRVVGATPTGYRFRLMDPEARWLEPIEFHRYSALTRVEFGSAYEMTLAMMDPEGG